MKKLYLTAVITVPSEEGQKRIDEALEKESAGIQNLFKDDFSSFFRRIKYKLQNKKKVSFLKQE